MKLHFDVSVWGKLICIALGSRAKRLTTTGDGDKLLEIVSIDWIDATIFELLLETQACKLIAEMDGWLLTSRLVDPSRGRPWNEYILHYILLSGEIVVSLLKILILNGAIFVNYSYSCISVWRMDEKLVAYVLQYSGYTRCTQPDACSLIQIKLFICTKHVSSH